VYRNVVKPVFDFVAALLALIVLSPLFIIIALFLIVANQGSPFFFQIRPGKNTRLFKVIKFKTMNDRRGEDGQLLPDELRLTPIGKFVRKTSLDEIPQLLNVLVGNMSLVGPRPLLCEYLPLYSPAQIRRHEVRPGITGWAQVNGRNAISWSAKFDYDIYYIDHQNFALDLRILILTVYKVFKAEGISGEGVVTAVKFNGKN
jgi:lipopolysaccharide/colanic/teichoic acid biosynthesis glycosyltransferase